MSVTCRDMACSSTQAFAVLSDGWLLGLWVVGASRIRDVDKAWPAVGAGAHHSVGTWPLLLNDTTTVERVEPGRSLQLRARAWPAGEARVLITVEAREAGCRVTINEDAVSGPGRLIPEPLRSRALHWRNVECLRRLAYLAENRISKDQILR